MTSSAERNSESVSTGELVAGRWLGTGGLLGPRGRISRRRRRTVVVAPTGPTVLMAVDGGAMSESVVHTAHRLFGDTASYLAINVGSGPYTDMRWAFVWPIGSAATWAVPGAAFESGTSDSEIEAAKRRADDVTRGAGLPQATPIGDVGDPTSAIIGAAHHHHADVVVIGADERGWLSRLLDRSVERELLRDADFAVLVATDEGRSEPNNESRSTDDAHADPLINKFTA